MDFFYPGFIDYISHLFLRKKEPHMATHWLGFTTKESTPLCKHIKVINVSQCSHSPVVDFGFAFFGLFLDVFFSFHVVRFCWSYSLLSFTELSWITMATLSQLMTSLEQACLWSFFAYMETETAHRPDTKNFLFAL
ncbi:hypothetical protein ILYODFUR_013369 [Ilyodon furcidens]|uniref:Uncharacterized protein n=1 Tax=Ilyodon furcidens TaxID=33524 RepID=A0ABV0U9D0_9TELE